MLNLRALYGSRMPQPLHPRADPEVSSYWEHDTAAAHEIARAMAEAEAADRAEAEAAGVGASADDAAKKQAPAAVLAAGGSAGGSGARTRPLALPLAELLAPATADLPALRSGDAGSDAGLSPPAQLSPAGLISIAAADIDDASASPRPRDLDWEFIAALRRRAAGQEESAPAPPSLRADEVLAQLVGRTPTEGEAQSPLRFLSLLRRINELRSQQHVDEAAEGLPYPQILALPTFRFEKRAADAETSPDKALCAVCYTDYEDGEELRALPCLHFYHRECVDRWLLHHRQCPICKHVVAVY